MADQFQTGVCGENWWNTSGSTFGSSLYSTPMNDTGNFGCPSDLESGSGTVLMDSTGQMMGSSLSSPATTSCNKTSHGSTAESNYHHPILQGDINSMSSASLDYPSKLLQTLFDIHTQSQNSQSDKPSMINTSTQNYQRKLNDFSPSLPQLSPLLEPLMPKLEKPNYPNLTAKSCHEDVQYSSSVVNEPELKRPRPPSPLPTFKVRKLKMGDRITALHQLVSPFGKTDTTSVLSEAIEYIKFLHEQVNVLSTPYMKIGAPIQHQKTSDKLKVYPEGRKQDLRSRGLCLVPVSTTFPIQPVVSNTTADFRMQMDSSSTNATKLENLRCTPQTCNCGLNTVLTESDGNNNKGRSYYGCPNQKCMYWNWSKPIPLDEISSASSIKQPVNQKVAKGQVPELDMFSKWRSQNAYFSQRLQGFEASHRLMKRVLFATMMLSIVAIIIGVIGLIGK